MPNYVHQIDRILEIVAGIQDPAKCYAEIISVGRKAEPSKIWDALQNLDIANDIDGAANFLQKAADGLPQFNAMHIGLDAQGLMEDGAYNIELSIGNCDNTALFLEELEFASVIADHQYWVPGLAEVERLMLEERWSSDERQAVEYLLFLGYSGIVFREALFRLKSQRDFVVMWGFQDGDIFPLLEKSGSEFKMLRQREQIFPEDRDDEPAQSESGWGKLLRWIGIKGK